MRFYTGMGIQADNPADQFTAAYEKSRLGKLLGDSYGASQQDRGGLLAQIARIDPQAAQAVDQRFSNMDEKSARQLQTYAQMASAAWKSGNKQAAQGIYSQMLPMAKSIYPGFEASDTLDDSIVGMFDQMNGVKQPEQFTLTPGSARYGADGKLIVSQPYETKPQAATFQKDAEGNGWWLRPGEAPIPADGSEAAAGLDQPGYGAMDTSIANPNAFYAAVGSTIGPLGGRITSTHGGKHNPGSNHPLGGAVDVGMGRETPEQQAAILQALQAQGYDVRDERTRPKGQQVWSGPHLHVEPGRAVGRRINFGKAQAEEKTYRTLSAKEITSLGLPQGTVAQMSPSGQVQIVNKPNAIPGGQTQVIDNGDGTQTIIPAGKTTEDQNKSAGYALRMEKALTDIAASERVDRSANRPGIVVALLDALPSTIGNYGKSAQRQNVEAAQLDALDAALTLNTGAAYTKEQLYGLQKSYFPQPGDDESTIKAKKSRLESLIQTARLRARGAYPGKQAAEPKAAARSVVRTGKQAAEPKAAARSVVRTGKQNGRKVVQYSDGSIDYAD